MRKLFDTITSTRTAAYLMAAVVFLVLLSAIVPQEGFDTGRVRGSGGIIETLQPVMRTLALDRIYSSPVFLIILALLSLGLLAGSLRRLTQLKRMRNPAVRAQHLGSVVFHIALVVVLAGAMLNRSYSFEGAFGVTEGQQVTDDPERYVNMAAGGLRTDRFGRFQLRLNSIDVDHPAGGAVTEAADVTITSGSDIPVAQGLVAINAPLRWEGLEFHFGSLVGFSPEIVIMDDEGNSLQRNFVRVGGHRTGPGEVVHEDFIDSPVAGQKLNIRVEPGGFSTNKPVLTLAVLEGETVLQEGTVAVGDTLSLGDNRIAVPRMRRWCYIQVVENPWIWLIFTGFWVGLAGQTLSALARVLPGKSEPKPRAGKPF